MPNKNQTNSRQSILLNGDTANYNNREQNKLNNTQQNKSTYEWQQPLTQEHMFEQNQPNTEHEIRSLNTSGINIQDDTPTTSERDDDQLIDGAYSQLGENGYASTGHSSNSSEDSSNEKSTSTSTDEEQVTQDTDSQNTDDIQSSTWDWNDVWEEVKEWPQWIYQWIYEWIYPDQPASQSHQVANLKEQQPLSTTTSYQQLSNISVANTDTNTHDSQYNNSSDFLYSGGYESDTEEANVTPDLASNITNNQQHTNNNDPTNVTINGAEDSEYESDNGSEYFDVDDDDENDNDQLVTVGAHNLQNSPYYQNLDETGSSDLGYISDDSNPSDHADDDSYNIREPGRQNAQVGDNNMPNNVHNDGSSPNHNDDSTVDPDPRTMQNLSSQDTADHTQPTPPSHLQHEPEATSTQNNTGAEPNLSLAVNNGSSNPSNGTDPNNNVQSTTDTSNTSGDPSSASNPHPTDNLKAILQSSDYQFEIDKEGPVEGNRNHYRYSVHKPVPIKNQDGSDAQFDHNYQIDEQRSIDSTESSCSVNTQVPQKSKDHATFAKQLIQLAKACETYQGRQHSPVIHINYKPSQPNQQLSTNLKQAIKHQADQHGVTIDNAMELGLDNIETAPHPSSPVCQ